MSTIRAAALVSVILSSGVIAADYLPLKENNRWTYTMSNGMEMTSKVVGFADVGTVRCGIVETSMGGQTGREYVAADAEGLKTYLNQAQGQEFRHDPPVVRLKLPYREGEAWTATVSQFGVSLATNFQAIGKERIQTPAGEFDCIKVRSTMAAMPGQPPVVSTLYYADGVGPVRQVMQAGGQELTATLTATNVKPAQTPQPAPRIEASGKIRCPQCGALAEAGTKFCPQCGANLVQLAAPTNCPKCNAKLPPGAKFCPACGEKLAAPAAAAQPGPPATPAAGNQPALEKYQSPDGKVLLYRPQGWNVTQGEMFGAGTYGVVVMEPQENAVIIFITFPVNEQIKDSVMLAAQCIAALREPYPDLQAANMNSTPERERTIADITLTAEGEKGTGYAYFSRTENLGSVYILLAKAAKWMELRPTLTAVAANLAFALEGVAAVQEQGRKLAAQEPAQMNQQWFEGEMANRAVAQQQGFRNVQRSIAEANRAFDGYLDSLQNASRSRDYTAHMWSQTTLGQGTWVAENEGARVYRTDSWGIEGPEGRIDGSAYNTTNFTGENPWGGDNLELVDTRAEYEKYIANR